MTNDETEALKAYFEANKRMLAIRPQLTLTILNTLLGAALWGVERDKRGEPLTIEQLAHKIGLPFSTVSQHLRYLGDRTRRGESMNLVKVEVYNLNRRQKTVSLTNEGRALVEQLAYLIGSGRRHRVQPSGQQSNADLSKDEEPGGRHSGRLVPAPA